jgi:serine/threonine protein kinase
LGQTIKAFGKLNERLVASYVTKILEGLHYLHTSHVVHCDLKAANILTTKNGNVKLSDFGVSLNLHAKALEEIRNDVAGTPNWSECVGNRSRYVLTGNHSGPRSHRAQRTFDGIRYLVSWMHHHRTAHRTSPLS